VIILFKWEYSKDVSVSSGDDCAWIDNIILPAMTFTSVYAGPDTEICENDTFQCAGSATNYISFYGKQQVQVFLMMINHLHQFILHLKKTLLTVMYH